MLSHANWHPHINAVNPPTTLREWLAHKGSLTTFLQEHCQNFYVRCINQHQETSLKDEIRPMGLSRPCKTLVREVLLCCDDQPVVFAHTIIMARACALNWPMFKKLGNSSLGMHLFTDAKIVKGKAQYARLKHTHLLAKRLFSILPEQRKTLTFCARRCLYRRNRGAMLVTEIFLPEIMHLRTRLTA